MKSYEGQTIEPSSESPTQHVSSLDICPFLDCLELITVLTDNINKLWHRRRWWWLWWL